MQKKMLPNYKYLTFEDFPIRGGTSSVSILLVLSGNVMPPIRVSILALV